jgi:serine/threonine protein kinase
MSTLILDDEQPPHRQRLSGRAVRGHRIRGMRCDACEQTFGPGKRRCPRHGTPLTAVDPLLGKVIDGTFRIDAHIGVGGMADVYRATHITLPGPFAVKVLSPKGARDPAIIKRFVREAEAQAAITHDHALKVMGWGHDARLGVHYMGMELVDGENVRDLIRREGPLSVERAVGITCQVLDALGAAHRQGALHRDLKPQNIMITAHAGEADHVRVLDFGGKRIERGVPRVERKARTVLTLPGTLFGTPAYMAPEQARGEVLDERADVYAAAVTLMHMLLGKSPFKGRDLHETLTRVLTMAPPRPSLCEQATRQIPPGLEAVLLKALAKDPDHRFESARAFRAALLKHSGQAAPPAPVADDDGSTRECLLRVFRTISDEVASSAGARAAA